ncbi:hypothetical protein NDU88_000629, partial [Pleurodeles waltl]
MNAVTGAARRSGQAGDTFCCPRSELQTGRPALRERAVGSITAAPQEQERGFCCCEGAAGVPGRHEAAVQSLCGLPRERPPPQLVRRLRRAAEMSFVRVNRSFASRGGGKRIKVKKRKAVPKQDWDCTISDLTVHRATPEDLVRRHEIHKSKNHGLAQWELREKTLMKRWRKKPQEPPDSFEKKRLAIMKEVLYDHYQLQDVLEKSDMALGAVKDLFGDAPRRRTGFPNITVAPHCDLDCSRGPIAQRRDPQTQLSVLSESVMDSQALNELDDSSQQPSSDHSMDMPDVSVSIYSNVNADRMLHLLKEENTLLEAQLLQENQSQMPFGQSFTNQGPPSTPDAQPSLADTALNATTVVKKTRSRLQAEKPDEASESTNIGQVLNPCPKKSIHAGRKGSKSDLQTASLCSLMEITNFEGPSKSQSSLEVLTHMIQEVEKELGDYEHQTGRMVMASRDRPGLTGFTLSLVNSLSRMVRYLKEGETHLKRELEDRKRLEEELNDHRMLIDALTAEIMALRQENTFQQTRLQLQAMSTDEQLISLTQAFQGIPSLESTTIFHCRPDLNKPGSEAVNKVLPDNSTCVSTTHVLQAVPDAAVHVSRTLMLEDPMGDIKAPVVEGPVKHSLRPSLPEVSTTLPEAPPSLPNGPPSLPNGPPSLPEAPPSLSEAPIKLASLPAHIFQPAVMLSPPRQKNTQGVRVHPTPAVTQPSSERETLEYQKMKASPGAAETKIDESRLFAQQWSLIQTPGGMKNTTGTQRSVSLPPTKQQRSALSADGQDSGVVDISKGDGKSSSSVEKLCDEELVTKIANLTMQNSILKAQLMKSKVDTHTPEVKDGQQQLIFVRETIDTSVSPGPCPDPKGVCINTPAVTPVEDSIERRIAELNRQSAEARKKLLQLIEQQKHATAASPPISPISSEPVWSESKGKTIEVSIPGHEPADSSVCLTTPPASVASGRRSYSPVTPPGISDRLTLFGPRPKPCFHIH